MKLKWLFIIIKATRVISVSPWSITSRSSTVAHQYPLCRSLLYCRSICLTPTSIRYYIATLLLQNDRPVTKTPDAVAAAIAFQLDVGYVYVDIKAVHAFYQAAPQQTALIDFEHVMPCGSRNADQYLEKYRKSKKAANASILRPGSYFDFMGALFATSTAELLGADAELDPEAGADGAEPAG